MATEMGFSGAQATGRDRGRPTGWVWGIVTKNEERRKIYEENEASEPGCT